MSLTLLMLIFILEPNKIEKLIRPIIKTIKNINFRVTFLSFWSLLWFNMQTAAKCTNDEQQ